MFSGSWNNVFSINMWANEGRLIVDRISSIHPSPTWSSLYSIQADHWFCNPNTTPCFGAFAHVPASLETSLLISLENSSVSLNICIRNRSLLCGVLWVRSFPCCVHSAFHTCFYGSEFPAHLPSLDWFSAPSSPLFSLKQLRPEPSLIGIQKYF